VGNVCYGLGRVKTPATALRVEQLSVIEKKLTLAAQKAMSALPPNSGHWCRV
jgi:hypothetical protein